MVHAEGVHSTLATRRGGREHVRFNEAHQHLLGRWVGLVAAKDLCSLVPHDGGALGGVWRLDHGSCSARHRGLTRADKLQNPGASLDEFGAILETLG